ncbi:MAG: CPBP family intramembrane metalloprotease [Propionibacteriaceae bacterium]|nr:CPBP family intramembrane metalloprotease [Propionibacteriaceae bacterium]
MNARGWTQVAWSRVGWFYGIALGGAIAVTSLLWLLRNSLPGQVGATATLVATAVLYMPLPVVAALIVELRSGRRPLIATEWRNLRTRFWTTTGRSAGHALLAMVAILALGFAVAWVLGSLGFPGAGHIVASDAEFRERILQIVPVLPADMALPPAAVVVLAGLGQGLLAGLTINALFAFGEEYGWRGFLADELRPLGPVRANLLTGVVWGLWHAPIIIAMGHNYGSEWGWGVLLMVAWTTPFAFILYWVRERSGSVLAPAFLHGAYNGTIGFFALSIIGGSLFVALPMGLLMALVLTVVAVVVWRLPARTVPEVGTPEPAVPGPGYAAGDVRQAQSGPGNPAA